MRERKEKQKKDGLRFYKQIFHWNDVIDFLFFFLIYNTYNTFYCMLVSPFLYWHLHHILDIFLKDFNVFL